MRDKRNAKADLNGYLKALRSHITQSEQAGLEKGTGEAGESEQIFRVIFDKAADGILLTDVESRKFYIGNKVICQMLGCNENELKDLGVMDIHPEEDLSYVIEQFEKQARGELTLAKDIPIKRKDGSVFYADVNAFPITLAGRTLLMGIFRDITERRKAIEEISRLAKFPAENPNPVLRVAKDGTVLYANQASSDLLEFWRCQVSEALPEDQCDLVSEAIKTGEPQRSEVECRDTVYALMYTPVKDADLVNLYGLDITERKKAEESMREHESRLNYLVSASPAVIYTCKTSGDYGATFISENVVSLTGYGPGDFVENSTFWIDHIHPEDRDRVLDDIPIVFPKGYHGHEYRFLHKDGSYRWMYDELRLVRDEKGNPFEIIGYWIDIDERKKMEEELFKERNRLSSILEVMESGVSIRDLDYTLVYQNDYMMKLIGNRVGEKCYYAIEGRDRVCDGCPVELAYKDGKSHTAVRKVILPSGEITLWENTANPIRGASGNIISCLEVAINITEREKAEQALQESEERLRQFMDSATEGFTLWDSEFNLARANEAILKMYPAGTKEEDLIGKNVLELIPDIKETGRYDQYIEVMKTGKPLFLENFIPHPKFGDIYIDVKAFKVGDGLGMITTDVTEKKRAEEELLFKTTILEAQSETIIDGILIVDDEGKAVLFNKRFAEMWNIPQDLLDRKDDEGMLNYALGLLKEPDKFIGKVRYLYSHKDQKSRDEIELKDGRVFDRYSSPLMGSGGEQFGRIWYFRDITERKRAEEALRESEERFRSLLQTAPSVVLYLSPDNRILEFNAEAERIYGCKRAEVLGKNYIEMFLPEDERAGVAEDIKKVLAGEETRGYENPVKSAEGNEYILAWNVNRVLDKHGCPIGIIAVGQDITEHKQMEQALHESEEKYRTLVETASDPIVMVDKNGIFLFVNKATAEDFECQPEDFVGKTLWDFFTRHDADQQAASIRKVIETGQGVNLIALTEVRGQPRWHNVNIEPLKDSSGNAIAALVIARDFHDLKQAEEQIRKLSSAVEQSIDGIAIADLEARLLYANDAYACIHGYTPEDMVGMKVEELHNEEQMDVFRKAIHQIKTQGSWAGEAGHVRKDGTVFPTQMSATLLKDDKGGATGILAVCRDITEYKKAQEDLIVKDAAIASSINGIAIGDAAGNLTYVNKSFLKIWGFKNQDEVLGRNAAEFWQVNDEGARIVEALQRGEGWIGELAAVRKDGSLFDVQVCQTSIRDENGTVISLMGSFVDITESKRSQEQLNAYREKMARTEQLASLGTLSATLAHELNQPLTVIRLSLESAMEKLGTISSPETFANKLKDSLYQVSSMAAITERFRNFARRSSDHVVREIDLKAVAERMVGFLDESARRVKVILRLEDWDELPPIYWDENDLEQLFFALVNNAIHAADGTKERRLIINGLMKDKHIELQFSDNCGGISPDVLDRIFEPFFTTKPPGQGTGLGLCIVQDIIYRAGGKIRVESKFGEGSTFFVILPMSEDRTSQLSNDNK